MLFISKLVLGQNAVLSFKCHTLPSLQGFTEKQIDTLVSRVNLEKYRLKDKRATLVFDNGFEIILLSANEIVPLGIIKDASAYPTVYPSGFRLPSFHLTPYGRIEMEYSSGRSQLRR